MAALERSDLQENATAYAAQLAGGARTTVAPFVDVDTPLTFNASRHGLCYSVGLLVQAGAGWSKAHRTTAVLTSKTQRRLRLQGRQPPRWAELLQTAPLRPFACSDSSEPLPVHSARILDYAESPESGVVFDLEPPAGSVFSRVNVTYTEGHERRSLLYKGAWFCRRTPARRRSCSDAARPALALASAHRVLQTCTRAGRCSGTGCRGCATATSPSSWCRRPGCSRARWWPAAASHTPPSTTAQVSTRAASSAHLL